MGLLEVIQKCAGCIGDKLTFPDLLLIWGIGNIFVALPTKEIDCRFLGGVRAEDRLSISSGASVASFKDPLKHVDTLSLLASSA